MLRLLTILLLCLTLSACNTTVLNPSGDIAIQQRDLLMLSTGLMLLIIVPVMVLTALFAWRYRQSNKQARYEPDWDHSMRLELVIWSAPLLIIIGLGALTWLGTHLLDPYRPLERLAAGKPIPAQVRALRVNVVALDWKWLFIYPEQGIATVNELALPVEQPIALDITASSVMNSLYIPELAGMIYAMAGMQTSLHGVMNHTGESVGFSSNYSGAGFSGMRFKVHALTQSDFDQWVATARASHAELTRETYLQLARPSEREPVRRYGFVDKTLYSAILGLCVEPYRMCTHDMMAIDANGGTGDAGLQYVARFNDGRLRAVFGTTQSHLVGTCKLPLVAKAPPLPFARVEQASLRGAGLPPPKQTFGAVLATTQASPSSREVEP